MIRKNVAFETLCAVMNTQVHIVETLKMSLEVYYYNNNTLHDMPTSLGN